MDKAKYQVFMDFCNKNTHIEDDEFVQQLKLGHFLVDDGCNELDLIRLRLLKGRFATNYLGLTIAPTADCNFRCPYCYEKDAIKPDYMTKQVEDSIVEFAKKHMKTIAKLAVVWYGGEPLMNMGSIDRLSKNLIALCRE